MDATSVTSVVESSSFLSSAQKSPDDIMSSIPQAVLEAQRRSIQLTIRSISKAVELHHNGSASLNQPTRRYLLERLRHCNYQLDRVNALIQQQPTNGSGGDLKVKHQCNSNDDQSQDNSCQDSGQFKTLSAATSSASTAPLNQPPGVEVRSPPVQQQNGGSVTQQSSLPGQVRVDMVTAQGQLENSLIFLASHEGPALEMSPNQSEFHPMEDKPSQARVQSRPALGQDGCTVGTQPTHTGQVKRRDAQQSKFSHRTDTSHNSCLATRIRSFHIGQRSRKRCTRHHNQLSHNFAIIANSMAHPDVFEDLSSTTIEADHSPKVNASGQAALLATASSPSEGHKGHSTAISGQSSSGNFAVESNQLSTSSSSIATAGEQSSVTKSTAPVNGHICIKYATGKIDSATAGQLPGQYDFTFIFGNNILLSIKRRSLETFLLIPGHHGHIMSNQKLLSQSLGELKASVQFPDHHGFIVGKTNLLQSTGEFRTAVQFPSHHDYENSRLKSTASVSSAPMTTSYNSSTSKRKFRTSVQFPGHHDLTSGSHQSNSTALEPINRLVDNNNFDLINIIHSCHFLILLGKCWIAEGQSFFNCAVDGFIPASTKNNQSGIRSHHHSGLKQITSNYKHLLSINFIMQVKWLQQMYGAGSETVSALSFQVLRSIFAINNFVQLCEFIRKLLQIIFKRLRPLQWEPGGISLIKGALDSIAVIGVNTCIYIRFIITGSPGTTSSHYESRTTQESCRCQIQISD